MVLLYVYGLKRINTIIGILALVSPWINTTSSLVMGVMGRPNRDLGPLIATNVLSPVVVVHCEALHDLVYRFAVCQCIWRP